MYLEDKILNVGEITSSGDFTLNGGLSAFYLFLIPKSDSANSIAVLSCIVSKSKTAVNTPLMTGTWNPIVINKVSLSSTNLSNYRVFWGTED